MPTQKYEVSSGSSSPAGTPVSNWRASLKKAERQIEAGRFDRALVNLATARSSGADAYLCTLRMASIYRRMERMSEAVEEAEFATFLDPTRSPGWTILLEFAEESGDLLRAFTASETLLKLSPRHIPAHIFQANALMQQGDAHAALKVINNLIQLSPDNPEHHFRKAQISQHLNESAVAIQEFVQVIRLDPEGEFAEAARESVEALDMFHLSQIAMLASEDAIFRAKLCQNCLEAIRERGYSLGPMGEHLLANFCEDELKNLTFSQSVVRYH